MTRSCVLAIDLGTSGTRVLAVDARGQILAKAYDEFPQHFPKPGWVEHDPHDYLRTTFRALRQVIDRVGAKRIAALGITNQRETTIVWDRRTGRPIYPAIVWQDRRTEAYCASLSRHESLIRRLTGLRIDPYFSASKLAWILDHVPGARRRAERGELLFGTPDVWLLWHLTGRRVFATEPSNAARTLLFNIRSLQFDPRLLRIFRIPRAMLPEIRSSDAHFGTTEASLTRQPIPVHGILGDQQASLFIHSNGDTDVVKNTYGTGLFLLSLTGPRMERSRTLLSTVAWQTREGPAYALEGCLFMGGAALHWLRDGLGLLSSYGDAERLARQAGSNEGVYLVPAFQGMGAPFWQSEARGLITGLTRKTSRRTLVRAALEAMAYQTRDLIEEMKKARGRRFCALRVDGGACQNNFLMEFQADVLHLPVERPQVLETTALGAAAIAGWGAGLWSRRQLAVWRRLDRVFRPSRHQRDREKDYAAWRHAIARTLL